MKETASQSNHEDRKYAEIRQTYPQYRKVSSSKFSQIICFKHIHLQLMYFCLYLVGIQLAVILALV